MKKVCMMMVVALLVAPQVSAQEGSKPAGDDAKAEEAKPKGDVPEKVEKPASDEPNEKGAVKREPSSKSDSAAGKASPQSGDDEGERYPHGSRWSDGVYGASGWWASVHVGGGMSLIQVNEGIAASGSQMTQGFSVGSTLHASHLWALSLDVSMSSVSLTGDALKTGWTEYKASNLLVTVGGKIYPWAHEYCSVALGGHVGLNQYDSSVVGDSGTGSWGGPELAAGGTVELAYFPMHALEIAANVRVDALLGGDNSADAEWQGTGAPGSMRLVIGANVLLGFHF